MKWLAFFFALFILAVIVLADAGLLAGQLGFVHALPLGDKIGHFVLIGVLSFLVISSLIQALPGRDPRQVALVAGLILAIIFGLEEASQGPIQGRDASFGDLAANYAGIAFFSWLSTKLKINTKRT